MVSLPVQGHFLGIIKEYNLNIRMLENLNKSGIIMCIPSFILKGSGGSTVVYFY